MFARCTSMFYQLLCRASAQFLTMFDFMRSIDVLQTDTHLTFTSTYNGSGNAPIYRDIISNTSAFDCLSRAALSFRNKD